ncbi:hypothetical protein BGZ63DRAFT_376192 [Mariannaea sp. PMI_226]|nr:hypothetical protein BGZ63DRAFT_376192 [Mariannaea sp. PMI_226]
MPPRCGSLRATTVPIVSQDGLWITDTMLRQAVERYIRFSTHQSRHISSCPGPIESRRRLGKRHMTAIGPESYGTPPPWSIEFSLRPGEWKWEAPNTPEDRILNSQKFSLRRKLDRFITWLENYEDQSPPAESISELATLATEVSVSNANDTSQQMTLLVSQLNQRIEILNVETLSEPVFWEACQPFYTSILGMIKQDALSAADFRHALQPFSSTVKGRFSNEWLGRASSKMAYMFISPLSKKSSCSLCTPEFRQMLVEEYMKLDKQHLETHLVFSCVAKLIRKDRARPAIQSLLLDAVESYIEFKAFQIPHHKAALHHIMISSAVRYLSPNLGKSASVWQTLEDRLNERYSNADFKRVQRQLAVAKSFYPSVRTEDCLRTYSGPWASGDAFLFTMGRLWATQCFSASSTLFLANVRIFGPDSWTRLVKVISRQRNQDQQVLFDELCSITAKTGYFDDMARQLAMDSEVAILKKMAYAGGDYKRAIALWEAASRRHSNYKLIRLWDWTWTDWTPYVKAMINDPDVSRQTIWRVLALNWHQPNKPRPDKRRIKSQTRLLELMAGWFIESDHLTHRQVLTSVEQCLNRYQSIDKKLSWRMLGRLIDVVVRDLENGFPGRQERLAWMVSLIRKHKGDPEADKVLLQLQGWRWTIENQTSTSKRPSINRIQRELNMMAEAAEAAEATEASAPRDSHPVQAPAPISNVEDTLSVGSIMRAQRREMAS